MTRKRRPPSTAEQVAEDAAELPPPTGSTAHTVQLGGDEYLVLSVPIPTWQMPDCLTSAERAVAMLVLGGLTNEEVARKRRTSTHTIANQIARIFAKLGVASRIELAHRLASTTRGKNCP